MSFQTLFLVVANATAQMDPPSVRVQDDTPRRS